MDENIVFDESKMSAKKKFFIFVIVFGLLVFGIIFFFNSFNFSVKKVIELEVGDTLSLEVKDYINNKPLNYKDYKLDLNSVKTEDGKVVEVGEYTYRVTLKDTIKEGKIKVIDTMAPYFETMDLTIGTEDEITPEDFVTKYEEYSLPCTFAIEGDYDTTKVGEYNIRIVASDNNGNKATNFVKLTVKEGYSLKDEKSKDLEPKYMEPDYGDWDKKYVIKFSGGFDPNDTDNYRWSYYTDFLNSDYNDFLDSKHSNKTVKSAEVIAIYNKYHYIIGFAARATLNDGTITYLTNGE